MVVHTAYLVTDFIGDVKIAEGLRVGYLPQEPTLDPEKDVKGNIYEGIKEKKEMLDEYNEVMVLLFKL
jgi:ATPase subunit of ABC transporter with duplicated ATPase domains